MGIDIVAINIQTRDILFGEVEWRNRKMDVKDYIHLREKAIMVPWNKYNRNEYYALFSREGFTDSMKELAKKEKVLLFDSELILEVLVKPKNTLNKS